MLDFSSPDFHLHVDLGLLILLCYYMHIHNVAELSYWNEMFKDN